MKKCMKRWLRWMSIMGGIIMVASITSFVTTKKTVWITLKRQEKNQ